MSAENTTRFRFKRAGEPVGFLTSLCVAAVSAEEGEELREGGDPHSIHELAGPRRARGGAASAETEAPRQRFQELLQRSHHCSLQVRLRTRRLSAHIQTKRTSLNFLLLSCACPDNHLSGRLYIIMRTPQPHVIADIY